ncbi:MAG: hypothetical protein K2G32_06770 [Oscillospiraceae bacterium]|nr:hypothetical protein [Oscillospiraceae bacterium]
MTFFGNELMKMFGKNEALTDIRCVGNTLVGRLTPDTIAKISFISTGIHGQYTTALIKVINPQSGEVDRQGINFSDAFGYSRKQNIHIWDSSDGMTCWYRFSPSRQNYEDINRAAQQYLEMFLEPVQDMGMSM